MRYIYDNLDSVHSVISVFLDFAKTYDSVDHEILLQRTSLYEVRGGELDWFRSYLTQREQDVSIRGINSGHRLIEYGVPQISILGPLLFLIFFNDFPKCSNLFKFTQFASDSTLTSNLLSTILKDVFHWINVKKIQG